MGSTVACDCDPLASVDRASLVDSRGVTFEALQKSLRPRYARVWFDVGCGYLALGGAAALLIATPARAWPYAAVAVPVAAVWIGYFTAYLLCFLHEAAHY